MTSNKEIAEAFKKYGKHRGLKERSAVMGAFVKMRFDKQMDSVSPAHNWGHVQRVSAYAPEIVKALGGSEREAEVARTAGYMHDIVRFPTETESHGQAGARKAKEVFSENEPGPFGFTKEEAEIILNAISKHESPPPWLKTENRDKADLSAADRIQLAVWLADKLEANGYYVLARRAGFVGGERVREGDLAKKGFTPKDAAMAVAAESYIRLHIKNDQNLYPKYFRPVVDEMFDTQREFYYPLLKGLNISEEELAAFVVEKGMAGKEEVKKVEAKRSDSKKTIQGQSEDAVKSSLEVISHFSSAKWYSADLRDSINTFNPRNEKAKEWKRGMQDYLQGNLKSEIKTKMKLVEAESPPVTAARERRFYNHISAMLRSKRG